MGVICLTDEMKSKALRLLRAAAGRYDLGFVPLGVDRYCLAMRSQMAGSEAARHLVRRFQGETFRRRLAALPGYLPVATGRGFVAWRSFAAALARKE